MPLLGFVFIVASIVATGPEEPCSAATPCLPSRPDSIALGLLFGSMAVGYVHWRTAAWFAVGAAVAILVVDFGEPAVPWWTYLLLLGYVAGYWYFPESGRGSAASAVASSVPVTDHRPVPRPAVVPVLGRPWLALAAVLATGTIGMSWWSVVEQDRKDAQQQAARVMTGVVREHRDDYTARVEFPDGRQVNADVLEVGDYPVGGPMDFYVDGRGLMQPVSEPYDASGWLVLATIGAAAAIALALRTVDRNSALRRLFSDAQPVRQVGAVEQWRAVQLFLPGPRPGRTTLATVPVISGGPTDDESDVPDRYGDSDDDEPDAGPDTGWTAIPEPAVLYGDPRPGHWCAVQVDGRVRLPRNPVRPLTEIPATSTVADHRSASDEPLVDPALVIDADRWSSPADVRFHRQHPLIRWTSALASVPALLSPVGLVFSGPLDALPLPGVVAVAAPLTAVALFYGWRRHLRSYLCWNAGGLVLVTTWRVHRLSWSAGLRVGGDGSEVSMLDDETEQVFTVAARQRIRFPPAASGERTAEQLRHALRHARDQAVRGEPVSPPDAEVPRPPLVGLLLCWAAIVPAASVAIFYGL